MKYTWNISKQDGTSFYNGKHNPIYRHYCRIERDFFSDKDTKEFLAQLRLSFPKPEYNITLTYWQQVGRDVPLGQFEEETCVQ